MTLLPPPQKLKPLPTRKVREADVEQAVCRYAKDKGILVYKFTSPNHRSVPDRIFIPLSGSLFFIEFKRPGGKLTTGQENEIARLQSARQYVYVIDNVDDGKRVIDKHLHSTTPL